MIGIVFTLLTPSVQNSADLDQNYDGSRSKISNITYIGGTIVVPKSLPLFKSVKWEDPAKLQNQFLTQFNVVIDEDNPNIWRSDSVIIAKIDEPTRFSLESTNPNETTTKQVGPELSRAVDPIETAVAWVNNHFPNYNLAPSKSDIEYFSGEYELVSTSKTLASSIQIPFAQTANGYEIRTNFGQGYPLVILVDAKTNMIKKAVFYPTLLTTEEAESVPTISDDTAVDRINSEKDVRIVSAKLQQDEPFSLKKISSGELTSGKIVYQTTANQQLKPFYLFKGNFTDNQNIRFGAEVVVPAI